MIGYFSLEGGGIIFLRGMVLGGWVFKFHT